MTACHFNLLCVLISILGSFCHVFRLQDVEKSLFLRTLNEYSVGPLPAWQWFTYSFIYWGLIAPSTAHGSSQGFLLVHIVYLHNATLWMENCFCDLLCLYHDACNSCLQMRLLENNQFEGPLALWLRIVGLQSFWRTKKSSLLLILRSKFNVQRQVCNAFNVLAF